MGYFSASKHAPSATKCSKFNSHKNKPNIPLITPWNHSATQGAEQTNTMIHVNSDIQVSTCIFFPSHTALLQNIASPLLHMA